jgi:aspartate/methionine/tyrosine aminotransferase
MPSVSPAQIPVAARVSGFTYAIRNIVAEAKKVEATGRTVKYLNIGDPIPFGFKTPAHMIEAVARAIREGHNGYGPSPGIQEARVAVADDYSARGVPMSPERVFLTSGTSEGIELVLNALANPGDRVLVPMPTYPLYTAVTAKIGADAVYYRKDPDNGWLPDLDHIRSLITPNTRALVVIDPNNPTGAIYPDHVRRELIALARTHGFVLLADEVYGDLAYDGPTTPMATLDLDAPVISFGSLSKAYLAPGWRAGWMAIGASPSMTDLIAAIRKLTDGRLCSTVPMQYAITAALRGDRSHQDVFRRELRERADVTVSMLNAIPGITCVAPQGAFYAMPKVALPPGKTDEHYVLALLREAGVLCVHGSGFGTAPEDGFFRVVFLAAPAELRGIYEAMAGFTKEYLSRG